MERGRLPSSDKRCSRMGAERGRLPSPTKTFGSMVPWLWTVEMGAERGRLPSPTNMFRSMVQQTRRKAEGAERGRLPSPSTKVYPLVMSMVKEQECIRRPCTLIMDNAKTKVSTHLANRASMTEPKGTCKHQTCTTLRCTKMTSKKGTDSMTPNLVT